MQKNSYQRHDVDKQTRTDGAILLRSNHQLSPVAERTGDWLRRWQQEAPGRVFIAERSGAGWREETYHSTLQMVRALAQSLVARGLNKDTPILIMSGNGVDHGLLSLAAQYAGIPTVPVAEQYSLIPAAHERLRHAISLVKPKMAYVVDADVYGKALDLDEFSQIDIVASHPGNHKNVTSISQLLKGDPQVDIDAVHSHVDGQSVAKILMTSGSTSSPKGVETTQKMMCANQAQIADALPLLRARPPRIVDWLPWNHVFGGSHNFNMMLANGGSLYIDDGKPVKGQFERTLENLSLVTGTLCFNVPVGFSMLVEAMRHDKQLKQHFFKDLELIFYAGASLPQDVWNAIEEMANEVSGQMPLITASWGMTETAPACIMQHEPIDRAGVVGVPLNGVDVKLIPDEDQRCEVRVKGPNIFTAYYKDEAKTKEAFDDEGYLITGDAMVFVDQDDPNKGLRFDGRISEDFKLLTGTWVRAAKLRLDLLSLFGSLAHDLIITGADKSEIGVMIFPNKATLSEHLPDTDVVDGAVKNETLASQVEEFLRQWGANNSSSSTLVKRAIILSEAPSLAAGEMTAKGNLNVRKVLSLRANLLDRLYDDADPAIIKI